MVSILKFPSRAKRKRRIEFIKKSILFLIIVLVFFGGATFVLRYDKLSIVDVEITGTDVLNPEELKNLAINILEEKYFYLIPKKNFLLYPRSGIENSLSSSFKRISKISVGYKSLKTPRIIVVKIEERMPAYLWCGESKLVETRKPPECYFVDRDGYVFDKAPTFSENVFIILYGNLMDEEDASIGGVFLSRDDFASLSKFIYRTSSLGLISTSLIKKDDGDYDLELARAGKISFSLKDGTEKNISNLESALGTDPLKTNLATKPDALEYIDLRFGNKIFFKFR
ncbi:MAG: hypothetical protein A2648_02720 [Candidatus Lloydbacteria bacterium RIFCSPHIGHO2_01_FULL_41_20]|uniref:POTRA domain-containing protein n=1 Tax=Candidatus Lloydbacteria bacterium RIFCSPHIGHO2_01_FULL_41_20 TaxID=1798657 RepID=A0A1G2CVH4_9BACT|nr:MAG: hypothetical protein A2648_02720 [Candidatus Lloydbacteria bacterium RIFCSPHIGHO2_01_FULL_41_20]